MDIKAIIAIKGFCGSVEIDIYSHREFIYLKRQNIILARIMSFFLQMTLVTVLILQSLSPALAQEEETCPMTLDTLPDCITHHWEKRHIEQRVYKSLLAKADAAIEARDRGHIYAAIFILKVFIHEVRAQSPKKIMPEAASHMITHAQTVIKDLRRQRS